MNALLLIPVGIFLCSVFSFFMGIRQWQSGSAWTEDTGSGPLIKHESGKRVGFFTIGANVFGVILLVIAIGVFVVMQMDK